jgi:hypothetical protein
VHCPQHMAVQSRVMWSSGCDWMEVGYQLVPLRPGARFYDSGSACKR